MKLAVLALVIMALILPNVVSAAEMMASEKLVLALLDANPEIDEKQHIFLAWRGLEFDTMSQFDLVLLIKLGKVYAITDSKKLAEIFDKEKKRSWELIPLDSGEVILIFDKPKETIESLLEKRFDLRILSKTTLTPV